MKLITRRSALEQIGLGSIFFGTSVLAILHSPLHLAASEQFAADKTTIKNWMDAWMGANKKADAALYVGRFADPIYFLMQPITWTPNPGEDDVRAVTVPVGFITDFASIPQIFWSALKPDGNYAWAAVVHDYLYWTQTTTKDAADKTLLYAMDDFGISTITKNAIYDAVHLFGRGAWDGNAKLKANGEKRILKRYPTDPTTTWADWKKVASNFE